MDLVPGAVTFPLFTADMYCSVHGRLVTPLFLQAVGLL